MRRGEQARCEIVSDVPVSHAVVVQIPIAHMDATGLTGSGQYLYAWPRRSIGPSKYFHESQARA
jgi:hypothetical protein